MADTNHRFLVRTPSGWSDQTIHTILGPEVRGVRHALTIAVDEDPDTRQPEAYAVRRAAAIRSADPGLEVLKEDPVTLPSGREAFEFTTKSSAAAGPPIITRRIYLVEGKRAFTFTATLTKHTLHTLGAEVMEIIDSLTQGE